MGKLSRASTFGLFEKMLTYR